MPDARRRRRARPTSAPIAPGSTAASGFRNTRARRRARQPRRALAPRANPTFAAAATTRGSTAACAPHGAAVGARVVDHDDLAAAAASTRPRLARQRASARAGVPVDDDDGHAPAPTLARLPLAVPHARPAQEHVEGVGGRDEEARARPRGSPASARTRARSASRLGEETPDADAAARAAPARRADRRSSVRTVRR